MDRDGREFVPSRMPREVDCEDFVPLGRDQVDVRDLLELGKLGVRMDGDGVTVSSVLLGKVIDRFDFSQGSPHISPNGPILLDLGLYLKPIPSRNLLRADEGDTRKGQHPPC